MVIYKRNILASLTNFCLFLDSKLRHNKGRGQDVLYFRFSDKLSRSRVQKALLWVHVRGLGGLAAPHMGPGVPVTITVLRVLRGPEWAETALSNIISVKVRHSINNFITKHRRGLHYFKFLIVLHKW